MTNNLSREPFAITMGEPAGIGGEILIKAFCSEFPLPPLFAIDDPKRLELIAKRLGIVINIRDIDDPKEVAELPDGTLGVLPLTDRVDSNPGEPSIDTAGSVIESIELAVRLCMRGDARGLITSPIHKSTLFDAGFRFPGHTEYLAHLTKITTPPVMMLAGPTIRVVPVTIHQSLSNALETLTQEMIIETALITAKGLQKGFGIQKPRLAVAGLNPHAGEDGAMGREEIDMIIPAVEAIKDKGIDVTGPIPPDALFTPKVRENFDAAICMYHDQALIPIKALDFDQGVNITLGLPIIRTSPDHGTAFNIAGTGKADPSSLIAAIQMAGRMGQFWQADLDEASSAAR